MPAELRLHIKVQKCPELARCRGYVYAHFLHESERPLVQNVNLVFGETALEGEWFNPAHCASPPLLIAAHRQL